MENIKMNNISEGLAPTEDFSHHQSQEEWEKEFDEKFSDGEGNWKPVRVNAKRFYIGGDFDGVKLFIQNLLLAQKREWREKVEKQINETTGHALDYKEDWHKDCMTCEIISDLLDDKDKIWKEN